MSKVCDISKEKYWLAKMSEKYEYFYTKDFLFLLNFEKKKICALHRKEFSKYPLFATFLPNLIVNHVRNI